jgi:hypothetical protein
MLHFWLTRVQTVAFIETGGLPLNNVILIA